MQLPATQAHACMLPCGATAYIYLQDESKLPAIAKSIDGLLSWLGTPRGFRVFLWYRDDPRICPAGEWPTVRTVNGGWATPGTPEVFVFRAEEYMRVLIHEIIHAMKWDWVMPTSPLACWGFKQGDRLMPHLFEAWTELYAEVLYCVYYNIPWEAQCAWQQYQAVQVLARAARRAQWIEETNVYAYYVLKAALAPHISFLLAAGNGQTPSEREYVLCELVEPELRRLRALARKTRPETLSMRMTVR